MPKEEAEAETVRIECQFIRDISYPRSYLLYVPLRARTNPCHACLHVLFAAGAGGSGIIQPPLVFLFLFYFCRSGFGQSVGLAICLRPTAIDRWDLYKNIILIANFVC